VTYQHPRCKDCYTKARACPRCEQEHRSALYLGRIRRKASLADACIPLENRGF
jgi:hypothetical protein